MSPDSEGYDLQKSKKSVQTFGLCPMCKRDDYLVEHHLTYKPPFTISICQSCHLRIHTQMPKWETPSKRRGVIELPENPIIHVNDREVQSKMLLYSMNEYKVMPIFEGDKLTKIAEFGKENTDSELMAILADLHSRFSLEVSI